MRRDIAEEYNAMNRKIKILYWTPFFLPDIGGIETLSAKLLPALKEQGYDITVLTSHGKYGVADKTDFNGIPVFRFHTRNAIANCDLSRILGIRAQVTSLKQSFKPDLIHIHMSDPSVYFHLGTAAACPAPTIVSIHQDIEYFGFQGGEDTLLGNVLHMADWVTAVSGSTLSDLLRIAPEIRNRSSVIYNGVASPDIVPAPISFNPPRILCLGRLIYAKGIDLAIAAFASLLAGYPTAQLTIVGEGPERIELEKQVLRLGLSNSVTFTGAVRPEEVPAFINQATVVVMPSRVEGFPMRALEAGQMARPIIASTAGGLPEAIVHERTGLIVEGENSPAIADAVVFLLDHPEVASGMGRAARSRVLETFSLKSCVDSYSGLYRRLAGAIPRSPVMMGKSDGYYAPGECPCAGLDSK
jgi:glycosyltransferase involved in cell wall biosynthesis